MSLMEVSGGLEEQQRYSVHPLVRAFAEARLREEREFERETWLRTADYFLDFAIHHGGVEWEKFEALKAERANILLVMNWCKEAKEWQTFIDLEAAMRYFLRGGGDWHELIKRGLQAAEASDRIGDKAACAWSALISLSWTYRKRGDFAEALRWAEEAHESFEKLGDKRGIAASLRNLGSIAESQEKLDEAKDFYQQCIAVLGESADREAGYDAYVDLGDIARKQENYDEAHQFYDDRLRVWQEVGDPMWTAILLGKLGLVACFRGDYETAWQLFEDALQGHQKLGKQIGIAYAKQNLASTGKQLGKDRAQMQALAQEAVEIFERLGMKREHEEAQELAVRLERPSADD
jgi:tetratricopeptide (TPR) repeat protein